MTTTIPHRLFINRCFDLAKLGAQGTSPNPMVGAVLVYQNKIIGEGFHRWHGSDHAEVNCINSVSPNNRQFIKNATLYISLEPCCIVGNTPACTDLIKKLGIKEVIYSSIDPTPGVNGTSKYLLEDAGSKVTLGIDYKKGDHLIRYRSVFVRFMRPYIILKFAQSADGFMGVNDKQVWLSNSYTKTLSHKWRSEVDAIMVGTTTAKLDNPRLNTRQYYGTSPLRLVLDRSLRLNNDLHLLDQSTPTWVICDRDHSKPDLYHLKYIQLDFDEQLLPNVLKRLYQANRGILLVEGGSQLLQSFIDQNLWDEARVFSTQKYLQKGIPAPKLNRPIDNKWTLRDNEVHQYFNPTYINC